MDQQRNISFKGKSQNKPKALGINHLLIIGIDKYTNIPSLENAVRDADEFKKLLIGLYQFDEENVNALLDEEATRGNIKRTFRQLANKVKPEDSLIVFYSGHGIYDKVFDQGYWLPVEAKKDEFENYVSNSDLVVYLRAIKSFHTFLISDSCFSGTLFTRNRDYTDKVESIPSRWGLASGRNEPVSDGGNSGHSPFTENLLYFLKENTRETLPVSRLIQNVKEAVANNSNQTPLGSPLQNVGDRGGEFVFRRKGVSEEDSLIEEKKRQLEGEVDRNGSKNGDGQVSTGGGTGSGVPIVAVDSKPIWKRIVAIAGSVIVLGVAGFFGYQAYLSGGDPIPGQSSINKLYGYQFADNEDWDADVKDKKWIIKPIYETAEEFEPRGVFSSSAMVKVADWFWYVGEDGTPVYETDQADTYEASPKMHASPTFNSIDHTSTEVDFTIFSGTNETSGTNYFTGDYEITAFGFEYDEDSSMSNKVTIEYYLVKGKYEDENKNRISTTIKGNKMTGTIEVDGLKTDKGYLGKIFAKDKNGTYWRRTLFGFRSLNSEQEIYLPDSLESNITIEYEIDLMRRHIRKWDTVITMVQNEQSRILEPRAAVRKPDTTWTHESHLLVDTFLVTEGNIFVKSSGDDIHDHSISGGNIKLVLQESEEAMFTQGLVNSSSLHFNLDSIHSVVDETGASILDGRLVGENFEYNVKGANAEMLFSKSGTHTDGANFLFDIELKHHQSDFKKNITKIFEENFTVKGVKLIGLPVLKMNIHSHEEGDTHLHDHTEENAHEHENNHEH